jgi:hypothetical protein
MSLLRLHLRRCRRFVRQPAAPSTVTPANKNLDIDPGAIPLIGHSRPDLFPDEQTTASTPLAWSFLDQRSAPLSLL